MRVTNQLTDEQEAFLEKFMQGGIPYVNCANGREAVMDRAVDKYMAVKFGKTGDGGIYCRLTDYRGREIIHPGPTHFIALVNALMEVKL